MSHNTESKNAEGRPVVSRGRPAKSVNTNLNGMRCIRVKGADCKPRVAISTGAGDAHTHHPAR